MFIFHSKSGAGSDPRRGPITRSKSRSSASNESADPLITGGGGAQFGGRKSKSSSEIR